ncbi:hypothetical protein Ahy_A02g008840 [Arachis hypogaea]|uniref:PB1-like domain-containing protein n=1 Tax=Arachis hypogaea TaxID=3818 RepID=A0A445EFY1_ARAHY|nr:hypothetical protein Ahy_A02g008840 [Arachis hypogaea]
MWPVVQEVRTGILNLQQSAASSSMPLGASSSVPVITTEVALVASLSFATDLNRNYAGEIGDNRPFGELAIAMPMPDRLKLIFHHGEKFETDPGGSVIYTYDLYDEWVGVDENYLDVFAVTSYYRKLGYNKVEVCWFLDPNYGWSLVLGDCKWTRILLI